MLYSISGGRLEVWAEPQMKRYVLGLVVMFIVAFTPIWFWRSMSGFAYGVSMLLLLAVEFFGSVGMGAQRWIDLGFMRLQPSELMKVTLVMALASYYDMLDDKKISRPLWVLIPVALIVAPTILVLMQPNLGTSIMLLVVGAAVMFAAGVSLWYFGAVLAMVIAAVAAVFAAATVVVAAIVGGVLLCVAAVTGRLRRAPARQAAGPMAATMSPPKAW